MAKLPKDLNPVLLPINEAQKEAEKLFGKKDVLFLLGPAGTGKTHEAVKLALTALLGGKCHRMILSRPMVECGEKLGFLPGDIDAKLAPWVAPISDVLRRITTTNPAEIMKQMEIIPLAVMRGRTFDDCVAILDEAQNCTWEQLKLFLTRIGKGGRLIICGDPEQSDLKTRNVLKPFAESLEMLDCVGYVKFDESMIVRHPSLPSIMDALRKAEQAAEAPSSKTRKAVHA
jgi:phosphate starvation-inducible PhoH-like protein